MARTILQWGEAGTQGGQFNLPWGIAVDAQGAVCRRLAQRPHPEIHPDGQFVSSFGESGQGEGQFHRPSSVAVDSEGHIYIADWSNERVQVLGPDGSFQLLLRGQATLSKWAEEYFAVNPEEWQTRVSSNLIRPCHRTSTRPTTSRPRPSRISGGRCQSRSIERIASTSLKLTGTVQIYQKT